MKRFLGMAVAMSLLAGAGVVTSCDSDSDGSNGSSSSGTGGTAGSGGTGSTTSQGGDVGFDAGPTDGGGGGTGERVSSLALEQVWYLTRSVGNDLLIDFRTEPPTVQCNGGVGSSDGFEGTGVFTEPDTGDLIFYTDGRSVFNGATNQLLANGSGLDGEASATEPALIAPRFGTDGQGFYIFTNGTNVTAPSTVS